jgi:hypothetical protein
VSLTAAGVPDLLPKVREADRKAKWVVPVAVTQVVNQPKKEFEPLVQDLRSKDAQVRTQAALQLAELGAKAQPALPMLLKVLEDDDPQTRLVAAMVIARIERKKAEVVAATQRAFLEAEKQFAQPWRPVTAAQLQVALTDPVIQARSRMMVMAYIFAKGIDPYDRFHLPPPPIEKLGPEAVPALVEGLNIVAANRIGFC